MDEEKLKEIKASEDKAREIISNAEKEAKTIIQRAKEEGLKYYEKEKEKAMVEYKNLIAQYKSEGQKEASRIISEVPSKINEVNSKASDNFEKAIQLVIEKIGLR